MFGVQPEGSDELTVLVKNNPAVLIGVLLDVSQVDPDPLIFIDDKNW